MVTVSVSDSWQKEYPEACVGIMAVDNVANPSCNDTLELAKTKVENSLKVTFPSKESLLCYSPLLAYIEYYRRYNKTYHVLQQMESVALKGKHIPRVAALVEAMFMAELQTGLLTAGHDRELVQMPLQISTAVGDERYIGMGGKELLAKAGDMVMSDNAGIISSVICGPDFRTRITANTSKCLFVVYAPPGIRRDQVEAHLQVIFANIKTFAPEAEIHSLSIYPQPVC